MTPEERDRLTRVETKQDLLAQQVKTIDSKMDTVLESINTAKGSWLGMTVVFSVASAIGTAIGFLIRAVTAGKLP